MIRAKTPSTLSPLHLALCLSVGTLLTAIGSGCGASHPTLDQGVEWSKAQSAEAARELARTADVTCSDTHDCHPSVALLTLALDDSDAMCSAFLIADNILATNSHCVSDDLKAPGSSCKDKIWAVFPESGNLPKERFECQEVLTASQLSPGEEEGTMKDATPDYAFIRLAQKVSRPLLSVSRAGFQDQSTVSIYKINPQHDKKADILRGQMSKVNCNVRQGTLYLPSFDHAGSDNVTVSDCEIIHGNSGSPILNSRGEAAGIIQAYWPTDSSQAKRRVERANTSHHSRYPLLPEASTPIIVNLGTNFACLAPPAGVTFPLLNPSTCQQGGATSENALVSAIEDRFGSQLGQALREWARKHPENPVRWTVSDTSNNSGIDGSLELKPECAIPSLLPKFLGEKFQTIYPSFRVRGGFNRYLQLVREMASPNSSPVQESTQNWTLQSGQAPPPPPAPAVPRRRLTRAELAAATAATAAAATLVAPPAPPTSPDLIKIQREYSSETLSVPACNSSAAAPLSLGGAL